LVEGGSREGASLSEEAHCRGLQGRAPLLGPWVMRGRLWRQTSLFMGAQLSNLEWTTLLGTLRDG